MTFKFISNEATRVCAIILKRSFTHLECCVNVGEFLFLAMLRMYPWVPLLMVLYLPVNPFDVGRQK